MIPATLPATLALAWPVEMWRDVHVAVAVSGGADSVALFRCLLDSKRRSGGRGGMTLLHYDHRVRGEASAADANWVAELARRQDIPSLIEQATTAGPRSEETLRNERRDFYRRATDTLGARFLATGHTADDQAETVLFRLLRGSGMRGVAGIRARSGLSQSCSLVRPMLTASKGAVLTYLADIDQPHREDASNLDEAYTRNWLRQRVLPLLAERFPTVQADLANYAERAMEACDLVESLAAAALERSCLPSGVRDEVALDTDKLADAPPALRAEVVRLVWRRAGWPLRSMTASHWRRLSLLASPEGAPEAVVFPGNIRVERAGRRLTLAPPPGQVGQSGSC